MSFEEFLKEVFSLLREAVQRFSFSVAISYDLTKVSVSARQQQYVYSWDPVMKKGVIDFLRPDQCTIYLEHKKLKKIRQEEQSLVLKKSDKKQTAE